MLGLLMGEAGGGSSGNRCHYIVEESVYHPFLLGIDIGQNSRLDLVQVAKVCKTNTAIDVDDAEGQYFIHSIQGIVPHQNALERFRQQPSARESRTRPVNMAFCTSRFPRTLITFSRHSANDSWGL